MCPPRIRELQNSIRTYSPLPVIHTRVHFTMNISRLMHLYFIVLLLVVFGNHILQSISDTIRWDFKVSARFLRDQNADETNFWNVKNIIDLHNLFELLLRGYRIIIPFNLPSFTITRKWEISLRKTSTWIPKFILPLRPLKFELDLQHIVRKEIYSETIR